MSSTRRKTLNRPRSFAAITASLLAGLFLVAPLASAAPAVCPQGSEGDRPFVIQNLSKCVWVMNDNLATPVQGKQITYNIYCPGRMAFQGASKMSDYVGKRIVAGARIQGGDPLGAYPNIVLKQHGSNLIPVWQGTPHVFHYGCVINGKNAVATHIKVKVFANPKRVGPPPAPRTAAGIARSCRFKGSQNGGIAIGARVDREYKCTNMFWSHERALAKDVAALLAYRDFAADVKRIRGRLCVLTSSDFQCAPCQRSDKLIVRIQIARYGQACPRGATHRAY